VYLSDWSAPLYTHRRIRFNPTFFSGSYIGTLPAPGEFALPPHLSSVWETQIQTSCGFCRSNSGVAALRTSTLEMAARVEASTQFKLQKIFLPGPMAIGALYTRPWREPRR
jgi:hypothetical protein